MERLSGEARASGVLAAVVVPVDAVEPRWVCGVLRVNRVAALESVHTNCITGDLGTISDELS